MSNDDAALERITPGTVSAAAIAHLHRYALALKLVKNLRVLDLACGEGYGANLLASEAASVIGIDIAPETVRAAQERYGGSKVSFAVAGADALPLADSSIDCVVSFETLEHLEHHDAMLREIKRVLKPGGVVILSTPDRKNYSDIPKYVNKYHVKELYREEFLALMQRYFSRVDLYEQRMVNGSLIYLEGECGILEEVYGDFEQLQRGRHIKRGEYNLIVAGDGEFDRLQAGFFDATETAQRAAAMAAESVVAAIRNSASYRLGHALLAPLRWLKPR